MSAGSNVESRSRGISNGQSPAGVITVFALLPLRRLSVFPWRSVALNDGSVQPPASAPPTVSSVGLPDLIRLTATLHLCSVPGSAMGLSVHLKIFGCSEFAVCLSSSCRSCEFLLFIFTPPQHIKFLTGSLTLLSHSFTLE